MSLNSMRCHVGFFGVRNAGKSSVVNAVTNQNLSIVSPIGGTTTDPVGKAMELMPVGAVMIFDTPGIDDAGELGNMRVKKTMEILRKTDVGVLVVDCLRGKTEEDERILKLFDKFEIPYIIAYNKADLTENVPQWGENEIYVSGKNGYMIDELRCKIAELVKSNDADKPVASDLAGDGQVVVLVIPIDEAAPKGRLIMPQVQTMRDLIEHNVITVCVTPEKLGETLGKFGENVKLVICDSQVFEQTAKAVPSGICLTSFSILMARYKGFLKTAVQGAAAIDGLGDGDTVLICEGCTHRKSCRDIGTVKLPNLIEKYTGKNIQFKFVSGGDFVEDLSGVGLVIHCGGCVLAEKEIKYRMNCAKEKGVPFTNYGTAIAFMKGILPRSVKIFGDEI